MKDVTLYELTVIHQHFDPAFTANLGPTLKARTFKYVSWFKKEGEKTDA